MRILNLNGTPYENGKKSGEFFKERLNLDIKNIEEKLYSNTSIKEMVEYQFSKLKEDFPKYYEEVIGKADGLNLDRLVYFSIMCPEIIDLNFEHCTTVVYRKNNGKFMISHNEDDDYISGNFCLSKVKINDKNWFITNDMYNMPFGNGVSFNSYGIVKTINYCHNDNSIANYTPRYFSQRHISESSSIDDLIKRCKEIKNASGYHVTAIDINKNVAVSVEVFNDCILDIDGAINFVKEKGYSDIILEGHSYGCNKISYYYNKKKDKSISKIVLLAPCDIPQECVKWLSKEELEKAKKESTRLVNEGKENELIDFSVNANGKIAAGTYYNDFLPNGENDFIRYSEGINGRSKVLNDIDIPVLVAFGDEDECVLTQDMEIVKGYLNNNIKECNIQIIKGADHSYTDKCKELGQIIEQNI